MGMKLERASVSLVSLAYITAAVIGMGMWVGALAGDVSDNTKATNGIADIKTEQAVNGEKLKNLEDAVKELKKDQKDGLKKILEAINKK